MSLRVRPRPVQDGAARTCKSVAYGNMAQTRARGLNTHVEAGVLMQAKRHEHLRHPRNGIGRPSIHSKSAADHRSQHAGGSQPAMRLIVDERPSPVPERLHGRSAARSWRRRDAEGRTSAATRQRWARGERTDPMALSSRKGQFTLKWDEGAEKGENRDNGPVLHTVSHGGCDMIRI